MYNLGILALAYCGFFIVVVGILVSLVLLAFHLKANKNKKKKKEFLEKFIRKKISQYAKKINESQKYMEAKAIEKHFTSFYKFFYKHPDLKNNIKLCSLVDKLRIHIKSRVDSLWKEYLKGYKAI